MHKAGHIDAQLFSHCVKKFHKISYFADPLFRWIGIIFVLFG